MRQTADLYRATGAHAGVHGTYPRPGRLVVKVGSRLILGEGGRPDTERLQLLASVVAENRDVPTVLVSSGAVALGAGLLGRPNRPRTVQERQAAAAVGQARLIQAWTAAFRTAGLEAGQLLLANEVMADRSRYLNARRAFAVLLEAGIVPVVNENDSVVVDEIRVGDNDNLAAYTAALVDADLLVLLTDVDGVFDSHPGSDPGARLIPWARSVDELRPFCFRKVSTESVGGMSTKLDAAARAGSWGIPTVITGGLDAEGLRSAYLGRPQGTRIQPHHQTLPPARRRWMLMQARIPGRVMVDGGAVAALSRGGTSLLARGVIQVHGHFRPGDVVSIVDPSGEERARGIVTFHDRELDRIKGRHSREIEGILGSRTSEVVVRADKLVIMRPPPGEAEQEPGFQRGTHEDRCEG